MIIITIQNHIGDVKYLSTFVIMDRSVGLFRHIHYSINCSVPKPEVP